MIVAGVVLDSWKLPTFKKHLDAGGFKYTQHPGIAKDTVTLRVQCESAAIVAPVIKSANDECAKKRAH